MTTQPDVGGANRILVVHTSMILGGIESSLVNLLKYLEGRGDCRVDLVLWNLGGPRYSDIPSSVRIVDDFVPAWVRAAFSAPPLRSIVRFSGFSRLVRQPRSFFAKAMLRARQNPWYALPELREHYDVAISYRHDNFAPYFLIDNVDADAKYMWFHHGSYDRTGRRKRIDGSYYERMDRIVVVSESAREVVVRQFPALDRKIRVVPNIVDTTTIRKLAHQRTDLDVPPNLRKIVLTTVGRLSLAKGYDIAIDAAAILRNAGMHFIWYFVGPGSLHDALREQIKERNLDDYCRLVGGQANPYPYVAMADVYVQPSRIEAHPIAVLEAMVLQRPIVATNIPAIRAVLREGELGVLCELTPQSVAEAVEGLALDPARRSALSARLGAVPVREYEGHAALDELLSEALC